jgi:hypothetical protein
MKRTTTMGRKKKKRTAKNRAAKSMQTVPAPKKKSRLPMLAMMAGGVLVLLGAYFLYQEQTPDAAGPELSKVQKANYSLRETSPTLSPERFRGKTQRAYTIAREIPQVLDGLYCYCRCRENFGHKNLLTCFTSTHAST